MIPHADRRTVTVLFAELSGFTSLAGRLDPEDVTNVLHACFGELMEEVRARDGWIEKSMGDAILAIFGAPVAHEDDPARAVETALGMQARMESINRRLEGKLPEPLRLHVGVNTGLVVMGPRTEERDQSADSGQFMVIGDAVNLGSRLQDAAGPGEIVVGESTYFATRDLFEYRLLPPLTLKGKADRVTAYACVAPRARAATGTTDRGRGVGSPLVGRQPELATLLGSIERLLGGRGGSVAIVGEAGLGKSRLVAEARAHVIEPGFLILEGRAISLGKTMSYWPFREMLRGFAGITDDDTDVESWRKLDGRVRVLFPDNASELLPYLARISAINLPPEAREHVEQLDPDAVGPQVFLTAYRFFERLAQAQPTLLILEDVHWMDGSSVALMEHLFPLAGQHSLLVWTVSRPDPDGPIERLTEAAARAAPEQYTRVELAPLDHVQSEKLLGNLAELESPSLAAQILAKAEGNPFFIEEVIRSLVETGSLVRDATSQRRRLASGVEHVIIPDTLRAVIMARIDRLEGETKEVLKTASVVGRSFLYRVLRAVTQAERELDPHLTHLQHLEFIRERALVPEIEYMFKHAVTQETAYESILLQRRRELHQVVGQTIESLFADRLEEFYGLLAYHYARAEDWDKAQAYLFRAGDQAEGFAADAEALTHYEQAIVAYERAFGDRWEPSQRAMIERKIGEAYYGLGRMTEGLDHLERAAALLGWPVPSRRVNLFGGILAQLLELGLRRILPALSRASRHTPDNLVEATRAYERICQIYYFANKPLSVVYAVVCGLKLAESVGPSPELARLCALAGPAAGFVPLPRLAEHYGSRAIEIAHDIDHRPALGMALECSGLYSLGASKLERARAVLVEARDLHVELSDPSRWIETSGILAVATYYENDFDEAARLFAEIVEEGRRIGETHFSGLALVWQLHMQLRLGGLDDALIATVRDVVTAADPWTPTWGQGVLALAHLRRGEQQAAIEAAQSASDLFCNAYPIAAYASEGYADAAEVFLDLWEAGTSIAPALPAKRARRLGDSRGCFLSASLAPGCVMAAPNG